MDVRCVEREEEAGAGSSSFVCAEARKYSLSLSLSLACTGTRASLFRALVPKETHARRNEGKGKPKEKSDEQAGRKDEGERPLLP